MIGLSSNEVLQISADVPASWSMLLTFWDLAGCCIFPSSALFTSDIHQDRFIMPFKHRLPLEILSRKVCPWSEILSYETLGYIICYLYLIFHLYQIFYLYQIFSQRKHFSSSSNQQLLFLHTVLQQHFLFNKMFGHSKTFFGKKWEIDKLFSCVKITHGYHDNIVLLNTLIKAGASLHLFTVYTLGGA